MAAVISLSLVASGTNPVMPSNTKSLTMLCVAQKNIVDSLLIISAAALIVLYPLVLVAPLILPLLIAVVIIPTNVV